MGPNPTAKSSMVVRRPRLIWAGLGPSEWERESAVVVVIVIVGSCLGSFAVFFITRHQSQYSQCCRQRKPLGGVSVMRLRAHHIRRQIGRAACRESGYTARAVRAL